MNGANGGPMSYEGVWGMTSTQEFIDGDRRKKERIEFLDELRPVLMRYLKAKFDAEDWHGVQDAASDLRDLDCELDGLRY